LGRFDKYRFVEASSPSAFSLALKLSCCLVSSRVVCQKRQVTTYTSKPDLVAEMIEGPDALFGVTDIGKLCKSKSVNMSASFAMNIK
jgi:hypothetical protein